MFWHNHGDGRPALIDADDAVISHRDLSVRADVVAEHLAAPEKCLVFLLTAPAVAPIVAYLAVLRAGHAVLPVAPDSPALPILLATYQPDIVIGGAPPPGYRSQTVESLTIHKREGRLGPPPHPDLAVLLTTSGSTGSPKLVQLSHTAINANAHQIVRALRMGPDDRAVTTLSQAYSFGLSVINSHLLCGGSLLITTESPLERRFWQRLDDGGATTLPGVPFTYDMIRRAGGASRAPASLRKLLQAGGRMEPKMINWVRESFLGRAELFVMYGQTEATARIAVLPPEELADNIGAVGYAVPDGRLDIDADSQVVFRGPNVMMGYAVQRADLAVGDQLNGVLETGDVGRLDPDGRLWLTGRIKRIIKPFGLRINLDDLEAGLGGWGPLAVTGTDTQVIVHAESADEAALLSAAQALVQDMGLPASVVRVRRVQALPRGTNGKVRYVDL